MRTIPFLAILFFLGMIASCEKEPVQQQPKVQITPIEIGQGNIYGDGLEGIAQQNIVITDSNTWNSLMAMMNTVNDVTSEFTEQEIDFTQWTILASFDQIRTTGGYSIEYSSISQNAIEIVATVDLNSPGEIVPMVITQPFVIVKIPNASLPIVFD